MQPMRQPPFSIPQPDFFAQPHDRRPDLARKPTLGKNCWDVQGQGFVLIHYRPPGSQMTLRLNTIPATPFGDIRI